MRQTASAMTTNIGREGKKRRNEQRKGRKNTVPSSGLRSKTATAAPLLRKGELFLSCSSAPHSPSPIFLRFFASQRGLVGRGCCHVRALLRHDSLCLAPWAQRREKHNGDHCSRSGARLSESNSPHGRTWSRQSQALLLRPHPFFNPIRCRMHNNNKSI